MEVEVIYSKKKFGTLHPSGLNRAQRRAEAAIERGKPEADRKKTKEDVHDREKQHRADKVRRKQDAAHARAVARKEAAKGIKPSLRKRALAAIRAATQRRAEKKRRAEKHAQKVARQAAKTV